MAQRIEPADLERLRQLVDPSRAWLLGLLVGGDAAVASGANPMQPGTADVSIVCECPDDCRLDHEYQ